jgi:putative PEP-CTERM system histidine kinase
MYGWGRARKSSRTTIGVMPTLMPLTIAVIAHATCCLAYLVFALVLPLRGTRAPITFAMMLAAAATALWSGVAAMAELHRASVSLTDFALTLQTGAWLAVILTVLNRQPRNQNLWLGLVLATFAFVALRIAAQAGLTSNIGVAGVHLDAALTGVALDILGLVLVENMLRNFGRDEFWSLKYLAIGLGAMLGYDLVVTLPQFLTHTPVRGLQNVRPVLLSVIVLPLYVLTAVRNPTAQLRIHSSRRIVFHAATLIGAGVVFEGIALAAYYVRTYGGDNGTVLAVVLGFSVAVGVAVAAASAGIRARVRAFINENFFSYKYDYRVEWTKFIRSLSSLESGAVSLRVLRTLAEVLESPGGVLWSAQDGAHRFVASARWSGGGDPDPIDFDRPEIAALEDEHCVYVELDDRRPGDAFIGWKEKFPEGWIVVPLRYQSDLIAVALINRPRRPRKLDWEDRNLIELVALQLAAYFIQDDMARALADAEQLHRFNKRFAFVVHDIKNSIGQLDLVLRNAERFGSNPDFQADMNSTLRNVVDKLQRMLVQLRERSASESNGAPAKATDIGALVQDFVAEKRGLGIDVIAAADAQPLEVSVPNPQELLDVLEHVFANAVEATRGGPVELKLTRRGQRACVDVIDHGPGMTEEFINTELFRPLKSTKNSGLGIGAYQAREIVHGIGGDLEIRSKVGLGTTVTLSLPICARTAEAEAS